MTESWRSRSGGWYRATRVGLSMLLAGAALTACAGTAARTATSSAAALQPTASVAIGTDTEPAGTVAPALPDCTGGALPTLTAGILTVATAEPTAAPWFAPGAPADGQGLESDVAYAIAGVLGYGAEQVAWTTVDRSTALSGQATGFDLDLSQFTASELAGAGVDASTGYFAVTDAVVVLAGGAPPTGLSAVPGPLGVPAGAAAPVELSAGLATTPVGGTPAAAVQALHDGTVPAIVLPTPAAIAAVQADPGLAVAGQLPSDPRVQPEQFQALLVAGSPLTGCVSSAIDRLRVEGTLDQLAEQWVTPLAPPLS